MLGVGQIPGGCQVRAGMRLGNSGCQARDPSHPWPAPPRNGIYPLMNFAAARPLGLPRVLAPPPEEAQKAKTPTPEPFDSETRKVSPIPLHLGSPPPRGVVSGASNPPSPALLWAARDQVLDDHCGGWGESKLGYPLSKRLFAPSAAACPHAHCSLTPPAPGSLCLVLSCPPRPL